MVALACGLGPAPPPNDYNGDVLANSDQSIPRDRRSIIWALNKTPFYQDRAILHRSPLQKETSHTH
eukprot:4262700-Amphidinium_carterae.1